MRIERIKEASLRVFDNLSLMLQGLYGLNELAQQESHFRYVASYVVFDIFPKEQKRIPNLDTIFMDFDGMMREIHPMNYSNNPKSISLNWSNLVNWASNVQNLYGYTSTDDELREAEHILQVENLRKLFSSDEAEIGRALNTIPVNNLYYPQ